MRFGFLLAVLASLLTTLSPIVAEDWTQFRGPNASGHAAEGSKAPVGIAPDRHVVWRTALPRGHSSPIVFRDRIYLTAIDGKKLLTLAVERRSGKVLWQTEAPYERLEKTHMTGSLAQSSPTTDGERVYSFFGSCGLFCYDRQGKQLWHRPFGPFKNDFGFGSSPILVEDHVILTLDHDSDSKLVALDKRTGKTVWESDRGEFRRGYATPVVWEVDGRKQIVVAGTVRVVGYDPANGAELWTAGPIARLVTPTPVIGRDNVLYVTGWTAGGDDGAALDLPPFAQLLENHDANKNRQLELEELKGTAIEPRYGQFDLNDDSHITEAEYEKMLRVFSMNRNATLAIRPGGRGDVSKSHVLWTSKKGMPSLCSPIVTADHLFLLKDGGILTCLDRRTGQVAGTARLASGRYYASPILVNGKLLAISQRGEVSVVEANAEMTQVFSSEFGDEVTGTPAVSDGQLFVRTAGTLYCFGRTE